MKAYKLTDQNMQTHNGCQWKLGATKTAYGTGDLCTSDWLHFYDDPLLAVLLNPIHANLDAPHLFAGTTSGKIKNDHGLKFGCQKLTLKKKIRLPKITTKQRVRFAILCAKAVYADEHFGRWADDWLNGKDRSGSAAKAAAKAAAWAWAAKAAKAAAWAGEAWAGEAWAAKAAAPGGEASAAAAAA